jgi:hypothetical protein
MNNSQQTASKINHGKETLSSLSNINQQQNKHIKGKFWK